MSRPVRIHIARLSLPAHMAGDTDAIRSAITDAVAARIGDGGALAGASRAVRGESVKASGDAGAIGQAVAGAVMRGAGR